MLATHHAMRRDDMILHVSASLCEKLKSVVSSMLFLCLHRRTAWRSFYKRRNRAYFKETQHLYYFTL